MLEVVVTGLPRSRTAWLANFLTFGGFHCYHDVSYKHDSVRSIVESYRCISDPTVLLYWEQLVDLVPDLKFLVIRRELQDSIDSTTKALGKEAGLLVEKAWPEMMSILRRTNVVCFDYHEIDWSLETIWEFCNGRMDLFDAARAGELSSFKIESTLNINKINRVKKWH
jgi:hypothetical protein